jgi:glycosyltransferase involved in cell wall biosynthesis
VRILFVVQRYGHEVAGGAELHCRQFAERLALRGHDVHALTSCAVSYMDWSNAYPPGTSTLDGVEVHRLPVAEPRDWRFFGALERRTVWGAKPQPLYLQREWMRRQGPAVTELAPWLHQHASGYDVVVFFTYLYYTTWAGLPAAAAHAPTVLHPTAHDEPPLRLTLFEPTFRHASAFAFSVEEESVLVHRRFAARRLERVVGIGTDLDVQGDGAAFRRTLPELGDRPYLLFVGRVDPAKGTTELLDFFGAYRERNPGPLALVLVGEQLQDLPAHPDVFTTGFVSDEVKHDAIDGALALVQPSYFESFSMVLSEAWAHRRPALVNARCAVLEAQARRSGGGLPYRGFGEFEAALAVLESEPSEVARLGAAGREYVEQRYRWDSVIDRYEEFLELAASRRYAAGGGPAPAGSR